MNKLPVTIQINLAPNDYPIAKHLLKNQIDLFKDHVDEILLTIETKKSEGRFGLHWEENSSLLLNLIENLNVDNVTIDYIDYAENTKRTIANFFFGGDFIPNKDYRGGPYYCYFYGLYKAKNNIIIHLDSDIFLGGKSEKWIYEAYQLHIDGQAFTTSPLPGPPHPDDLLKHQNIIHKKSPYCYQLEGFSTRVFSIDKSIFENRKLTLKKVNLKNQVKAIIKKQQPYVLPELLIHDYIKKYNLKRIDFLGSSPGLWTLHPPYKTNSFFLSIPNIMDKINQYDFAESQLGFFDIHDSLFDWSEARANLKEKTWWKVIINK